MSSARHWLEQDISKLSATITEQRSRIKSLEDALREAKKGMCNLDPVIQWLNNGCEVSEAVKELSIYEHIRCKSIISINELIGE